MYVRRHLILMYLILTASRDGHRSTDMSPLLGLLFKDFCFFLCDRIPVPYCFCIQSSRWCKKLEKDQTILPFLLPHLCNKMNHFDSKLSFLADKQHPPGDRED